MHDIYGPFLSSFLISTTHWSHLSTRRSPEAKLPPSLVVTASLFLPPALIDRPCMAKHHACTLMLLTDQIKFFLLRSAHIIHQKTIFDWFMSHFFLLSFSVDLISLQLRSRPLQDSDLFLSLLSSSRPSLSTIWFTLYIYIFCGLISLVSLCFLFIQAKLSWAEMGERCRSR